MCPLHEVLSQVTLSSGDKVSSYFGMRTVEMGREDSGRPCVLLNGEILKFQAGSCHVSQNQALFTCLQSLKTTLLARLDLWTRATGRMDCSLHQQKRQSGKEYPSNKISRWFNP